MEPKKPVQALKDPSWVEAMQDELLQNNNDERGILVKNKARLVSQRHTQEEGIDYDEVFPPVASIEAIRLFLACASLKDFVVYQIYVKSAFLYGKIEDEVYVCQPLGFEDIDFPDKVYKVEKALYGLHRDTRAWRVQQKRDEIFISQDKYMADILKKFNFSSVKTTSTPIDPNKALVMDAEAEDVDVHLYRSMIGSLMYLITSRPDITFTIYACARDSPFDLEAYSNSDNAGASLDRKSKTGDETVYKEWEDKMERVATTASSLEVKQDSGNLNRTQSMETLNEPLLQGTRLGSGPRRHLKLEDSDGIYTLPNTKIFEQLSLMRRRRAVSPGSGGVSTASRIISTAEEKVSTDGVSIPISTASMVQESTSSPRATKDKGKAIMMESEPEKTTTKLRERQERAGYKAAIRLQEQQDKEENQRIARDEK
nr:hypothetical protein [Tanacetum cinerariifolium]